ncbi:MAG: hypothetical protein PUP91_13730 [Rhizonema sp. PD37]|nr:hypothetical protein [Rhizonema sp. PD37]
MVHLPTTSLQETLHQRKMTDFKKYPLLTRRLIDFAAHRQAGTSEHQECEIKGEIIYLNKQENLLAFSMPIMRRRAEFGGAIPMYVVAAEAGKNEGIIAVQKEIRFQQQRLADIKRSLILPSVVDYRRAEEEVQEYLKTLPTLSPEILVQLPISAREKFHLAQVRGLFTTKEQRHAIEAWSYCDAGYQALTEPLLQSFATKEEKQFAFITRNSYGVRCLNSLNVMFIDIDLQPENWDEFCPETMPWGNVRIQEDEILKAVANVSKDWELSFEVYRTKNGFRLIEMSRLWEPLSAQSSAVLETLGSDRLYQQLCQAQGCYRARLQPKPWRSGNGICTYIGRYSDSAPDHEEAVMVKGIHDSWCLKGEVLA